MSAPRLTASAPTRRYRPTVAGVTPPDSSTQRPRRSPARSSDRTTRRARAVVRSLERAGLRAGRWIELSGGVRPETVRRYRRVGADAVSIGALTHSAPALPFHLELEAAGLRRPRP